MDYPNHITNHETEMLYHSGIAAWDMVFIWDS